MVLCSSNLFYFSENENVAAAAHSNILGRGSFCATVSEGVIPVDVICCLMLSHVICDKGQ